MTSQTNILRFQIDFLGPFHVSSSPDEGLDRTVDREVPLPASGIKGLMRAQCTHILMVPTSIVDSIFGSKKCEAAWLWTDPEFATDPIPEKVARLRLSDSDDGAAESGLLMLGEHLWATTASFTLTMRHPLEADEAARHRLVLRAAARSIVGLGGSRRRGEGWVNVFDVNPDGTPAAWSVEDSSRLLDLRESAA
ncbi:hypothetical protein SAMN02745244_02586 [Tessaracoccus bendigoensis DSM 12906]|uniref:CRISPR type III-associated protein domain-containing protein n=1 Tax=Tessaracoccus bendigoensis DSM 12906 TaxID=1123357 RepID=A0A1M6JKJ5_9ACTN|nr:RAMP superfamily CRISPR-associated protein [Tessaracoccus bendigoensis]SHJ47193.1 hypothetical protein SAMN02745244_02586 [Tessaracoccus bendigoensis DSM 12906]